MKVAENMRISPRYVQRLLEVSGTSFTEQVNELRLQRAYMLLTEARRTRASSPTSHYRPAFPIFPTSTGYSVPASAIPQRVSAHPRAVRMRGPIKGLDQKA
jgi:AraC-like DNA-binding protein